MYYVWYVAVVSRALSLEKDLESEISVHVAGSARK